MTNLRQAAEQALEALQRSLPFHETVDRLEAHNKAITALRDALAEAKARRTEFSEETKKNMAFVDAYFDKFGGMAEPEQEQEPVLLECVTCGTVYADGVPPKVPEQKPFGYLWPTGRHPEFRFTQQKRDGVDGMPVYASPAPTAEDIAQDWNLLQETQSALRDAWAILKKLKEVQDAARKLVELVPDLAADTDGTAFTEWCALVTAIDDAETLLCEFGESHE